MVFRSAHPVPQNRRNQLSFPIALALALVLLSMSAISFAQSSSNSSAFSSSGHSSASAPSFSASAPASHAPASSGSTITSGGTHSGGTGGPPHSGGGVHNPEPPHHPPYSASGGGEVYIPYPAWYPAAVPYIDADNGNNSTDNVSDESDDDAEYQGGPTIFDRRGKGAESYVPPVDSAAVPEQSEDSQAGANESLSAQAPSNPTVLVFKDGHQVEVENYAVVGQTLYDLTPGHRRKVALAELDVPATVKLNDDRGVVFELPSSAQAN